MFVAQFNISKERYQLDHPVMSDFMASLDPVNGAADEWDGFVWRLHDESGNATAIRAFDDPTIIFNLSVWRTVEQLKEFVYRSAHANVLRRRREWFEVIPERSYVLWWVDESGFPTLDEAKARLRHLQEHGPTPYAFTFDRVPAVRPGSGDA
ncbi:DUF3291 domain-containing protein [Plantactinospora sp. B6F1]|uniref:DUF3291 domain-containing protein n=1 Tax=Plantactinospora sp. B6F1 TaxID=3158971 RepID=UPI0032D8F0C9